MKCVRFRGYGDPAKVLAAEECPAPEPGPEEARVRMVASPVNPSDLLYVRGLYAGVRAQFPARAGFEGVGIVDALGPGAHDFACGQRVSVVNGQGGNWAPRLEKEARRQLMDAIAGLVRDRILETSPGPRYSLDQIGAAVTQAESVGHEGKVLLIPG